MRNLLLVIALLCAFTSAFAQKINVIGKVTEKATGEVLPGATAVLLSIKDSARVSGAASKDDGSFAIPGVAAGSYILKVSYIGYSSVYRNITLSAKHNPHTVGVVALSDDAKMMKEANVVARLAQVEMKADTFVYNADAYRLPEGAALEDLVKKLPGAEVDDDGKITINGKEVKKIMVDGKEFFGNDTKMSMKNLPTKMINKIKAYDKKSDYSRITGIDDGEEETVLDLTVKKGMKQGWLINLDGAYGTKDRYSAKANVNRFMDNYQFSVIGSANNVNDASMPGGWGGRGSRGGGGVVCSQMLGVNFAWENGKKDYTAGLLKIGGNARFSRTSTESSSRTNSESFMGGGTSTWTNSLSNSLANNWNLDANFRLEWQPDSMTNILFRPNFSHSESNGNSESLSVNFDSDPYNAGMNDPLQEYKEETDDGELKYKDIIVNSSIRNTLSLSYTNTVDGNLQVNRRLGKPGRNITMNVAGRYSNTQSKRWNESLVKYFKTGIQTYTNRLTIQPSTSWNVNTRLSYTEPLTSELSLQTSYQFQYRFSNTDKRMYNLHDLLQEYLDDGTLENLTDEQRYLGIIPGLDMLELIRDVQNSQYATYNEYNHDAQIMFRYTRKFSDISDLRFNAGLSFQPQTTDLDYEKNGDIRKVTRNVFNWAPRVFVRYKINKTSQFNVRYNGSMSQPSMTNMLDIIDNTNPQNVSIGNPELESSWSNRFSLFYNSYLTEKQMGWSANLNFNQTSRSTSTASIYDQETGNRYSRPMNIDGNWNAGGNFMFNTAMGQAKKWNVSLNTNLSYYRNVGFTSNKLDVVDLMNKAYHDGQSHALPSTTEDMAVLFKYADDNNLLLKSVTKTVNLGESLRLNYRAEWGEKGSVEIGVNGGFNYQHSRNDQNTRANMDTWNFNYGGNLVVSAPWGMQLTMDCGPNYRRGYEDETMNTTEVIWNAQLSQSFLKNNALTLSAQWFDILGQRSNISRNISATMRSDTETNAINSYAMFHIIYKLNLVGNKEARDAMRRPGDKLELRPGDLPTGGNRNGSGDRRPSGGFGGFGGRM